MRWEMCYVILYHFALRHRLEMGSDLCAWQYGEVVAYPELWNDLDGEAMRRKREQIGLSLSANWHYPTSRRHDALSL
jgi:hypothetical protein